MSKAALAKDPVERMKYCMLFFISSNFVAPTLLKCKAPLNPIIGETL